MHRRTTFRDRDPMTSDHHDVCCSTSVRSRSQVGWGFDAQIGQAIPWHNRNVETRGVTFWGEYLWLACHSVALDPIAHYGKLASDTFRFS